MNVIDGATVSRPKNNIYVAHRKDKVKRRSWEIWRHDMQQHTLEARGSAHKKITNDYSDCFIVLSC